MLYGWCSRDRYSVRKAETWILGSPPSTKSCELWLDACVLHERTTFQPSQASNLLSFVAVEPGHLLHSALARPSSADARRLKSRHPFVSLTQHLISSSDNNNISAAQGWIINGMRSGRTIRLDRLHTGVGRFRTCLYKWAMASSAACECGTEEQTVDHLVLQCAIHRSPHGLHGLTVLDDETTEWLLNTCPEIWCGQAVVWTTSSKEEVTWNASDKFTFINNLKWIMCKHIFFLLLLTLNVPLQISKCTPSGTCTPVWEPLV